MIMGMQQAVSILFRDAYCICTVLREKLFQACDAVADSFTAPARSSPLQGNGPAPRRGVFRQPAQSGAACFNPAPARLVPSAGRSFASSHPFPRYRHQGSGKDG
jgi:hypothetical protein